MGYQNLTFNNTQLLAYVESDTSYEIKENDIIFAMQLNLYFKVTNEKVDTLELREKGYERVKNTQLKHSGVLKFKKDEKELYVERKSHLILKIFNNIDEIYRIQCLN